EFSFYHDLPGVEVSRAAETAATTEPQPDPQRDATALLERALRVGRGDNVDEWLNASALKQQMKRLESSFDEKKLGFKSFTDFIKSRDAVAELQEDGQIRRVRLRSGS